MFVGVFFAPGYLINISRSVRDGVYLDEIDPRDRVLRSNIVETYGDGAIFLWALKPSIVNRWVSVKRGDYILFYNSGKFIYLAKVAFKYPFNYDDPDQVDEGRRIAEAVWGRDPSGETWPYLIFLIDVKEIDISLDEVNKVTGYRLSFIGGFMRVKRADAVLQLLREKEKVVKPPEVRPKEDVHSEIVRMLCEIGEILGYKVTEGYMNKGYKFDVCWFRPPKIGPKYVFEVHVKGNLEAALLRLKHAYDLWESRIFLIASEKNLRKAKRKFFGELHELVDVINLVKFEDVKQFHSFKQKYEWLERAFGLRPR